MSGGATASGQRSWRWDLWPWFAVGVTLVAAVVVLRYMGRLWLCDCGEVYLWVGDAWSPDTSQHLLDPYSFTHLLHGVVLCWILSVVLPRLRWTWQLWIALSVEAAWELIENSDAVIQRYREAAGALGYFGDTIVNSLGDLLMCGLGFALARYLGFRRSLVLFVALEVTLLFAIRDSLLLNVVMLIHPIEWVKDWQAGP